MTLPGDLSPFRLSVRVASLATLLVVAFERPLAFVLARLRFPGKGLLAGVLMLPLVLPPTVLGFYLLQLILDLPVEQEDDRLYGELRPTV